jgi:hypothetical protein
MTTSVRLPAALAIAIALAGLPWALALAPLAPLPGLLPIALAALALCAGGARRCPPWLTTVLALELVALCLLRLLGAWPCDTACQGGGYYQHLGPLPVVALALIAYAAFAALAARDLRRRTRSPTLSRAAYALAGGSLFFLCIAAALGLACPFCRAVHGTMLIAAASTPLPPGRTGAPSWRSAAGWVVAGFLLLNLAFHHQAVADGPGAPGPGAGAPVGLQGALRAGAEYRQIDAGRSLGPATAPYRVLLVVDPHCRACAEEHGPLLAALAPLCAGADARLAISTQFLSRASDGGSADLVRHLLASALLGEHHFRAVLSVALGSPAGSGFAALSGRIAEVDDPAAISAAALRAQDAIALVVHDDDARLAALSGRTVSPVTPQVLLLDSAPGAPPRLLRRWLGALDGEALASEIAALIRP